MGASCMKPDDTEKEVFVSLRSVVPDFCVPMYLVYQYGMLFFILGLFGWEIKSFLNRPPGAWGDPYSGFVVLLMLLLNHLAYFFAWRRRVAIVLIVLAVLWVLFGLFYILYLSRLLFPWPVPLQ
jgi:hypothetical protein